MCVDLILRSIGLPGQSASHDSRNRLRAIFATSRWIVSAWTASGHSRSGRR